MLFNTSNASLSVDTNNVFSFINANSLLFSINIRDLPFICISDLSFVDANGFMLISTSNFLSNDASNLFSINTISFLSNYAFLFIDFLPLSLINTLFHTLCLTSAYSMQLYFVADFLFFLLVITL